MMVSELTPGTVVGGEFRVVRPLSAGGMGAVYVAEQLSTGQLRALKVMHPTLVQEPRLRDRFVQEARVGSHIASEHVVQVIAAGVDPTLGIPWLAMELLDGEDLARWARGPLPLGEVLRIFRPLCHALGAAHAAGVVHRDIKPENVFLARAHSADTSVHVKVLDFGIAKLVAEANDASTATIGTPLWMAPEQSDPRAMITPAADVWALGLLAFRLLTGCHYFRAANDPQGSLQAVMREALVEPLIAASARAGEYGASVPPGFDAWFSRAVDREPSQRFRTASEALFELERLAGFETLPAVAAVSSPPRQQRRSGLLLLLGVIVVGVGFAAVAVVAGAYFFLTPGESASAQPSSAMPAVSVASPEPSAVPPVASATSSAPKPLEVAAAPAPKARTATAPAVSAAPAPSATVASSKPFNRALAEQRLRAAEQQAASQCKSKKSAALSESYTGFKGFRNTGKGPMIITGMGGSKACVRDIMYAVTVPPYDAPDAHSEQLPFSVTVP
ncbi:MAG: protein kinase [Myxococcales bacterium]|nr:protein kinase [Myxococcales bacterium]MCB9583162.1 protein kinase [Polyangiaceae bacterium]